MILLDTQALIWWLADPKKLSLLAQKRIGREFKKSEILASSISVWEIAMLVKKQRLRLSMEINVWLNKVYEVPQIKFVAVDNEIALKSVYLPEPLHEDPADRMIVATSLILGCPIVTSDKKIRSYKFVRSIW